MFRKHAYWCTCCSRSTSELAPAPGQAQTGALPTRLASLTLGCSLSRSPPPDPPPTTLPAPRDEVSHTHYRNTLSLPFTLPFTLTRHVWSLGDPLPSAVSCAVRAAPPEPLHPSRSTRAVAARASRPTRFSPSRPGPPEPTTARAATRAAACANPAFAWPARDGAVFHT